MEQVGVIAAQPATLFPTQPTARQWIDSDDECNGELVETDWTSNVSIDILQTLSDAEKKRQEVINEIYQTERNHVRTLRLLEGIFMRPLQESGVLSGDHLQLLFPPSLQTLKDLHTAFENNLKQRRLNQPLVGDVGDLLLAMVI
jgi:Rho guanine nucleotide exchange factor 12